MLEKPDLADEILIACLNEGYGLAAARIEFLPLGNDSDAAAYCVTAEDSRRCFLKLRRDGLSEAALQVAYHLRVQGMGWVVAPVPARTGTLWTPLGTDVLILYPYIDGQPASRIGLNERQWVEYGAVVHQLHEAVLPPEVGAAIPQETFGLNPRWNQIVRQLHADIPSQSYTDPIERELAAFWEERHAFITEVIDRAESVGEPLRREPPALVLCHADIHKANLLVTPGGDLAVVDWDQPIFAPKERDLMFIVGGYEVGPREENLFFRGYGPAEIDLRALAYYRYEWVIQEMGDNAERVFFRDDLGEQDRQAALDGFRALFNSGDIIDAAFEADQAAGLE
ncbi:MAG: phosphotransferase [Anaerolineae bacterium]|nr:phosphotransferase [Anaerolineae bacterium]